MHRVGPTGPSRQSREVISLLCPAMGQAAARRTSGRVILHDLKIQTNLYANSLGTKHNVKGASRRETLIYTPLLFSSLEPILHPRLRRVQKDCRLSVRQGSTPTSALIGNHSQINKYTTIKTPNDKKKTQHSQPQQHKFGGCDGRQFCPTFWSCGVSLPPSDPGGEDPWERLRAVDSYPRCPLGDGGGGS